jgi:hypothetical protein
MKLRTFLMIAAIVAVLYAVGLILVPGLMDTAYGTGPSDSEMLTDQMLGSALLAWGLILWLAKDFTGPSAAPIIAGSLVGETVGFFVALLGTLRGIMNAAGWMLVVLNLLFALGFAYYQFLAPQKQQAATGQAAATRKPRPRKAPAPAKRARPRTRPARER